MADDRSDDIFGQIRKLADEIRALTQEAQRDQKGRHRLPLEADAAPTVDDQPPPKRAARKKR